MLSPPRSVELREGALLFVLSMGGGLITAYCSGPVVRVFFLLLGPSVGGVKQIPIWPRCQFADSSRRLIIQIDGWRDNVQALPNNSGSLAIFARDPPPGLKDQFFDLNQQRRASTNIAQSGSLHTLEGRYARAFVGRAVLLLFAGRWLR